MIKQKLVSYIFPVFNEEKYLSGQLENFILSIKKNHLPLDEILLVENGSTDNSWNEILKLTKKYSFIKSRRISFPSYGQAVKHGLLTSNHRYLFVLNVDFYDISFIKNSFIKLKKFNIVSGSKLHKNSNDSRPIIQKLRTQILRLILKYIFKYHGTDTHGIKAFRKTKKLISTLQTVRTKHELFDTELLLKLKKYVVELPVNISETRPTRYNSTARTKRILIDLIRLVIFNLLKPNKSKVTTADDFGMSNTVNNAILDRLNAKTLTFVSVMPNLVKKKDLNKLKKTINGKQIICHFNLLRGRSLLPSDEVNTLVNKSGNFYPLPLFLLKLITKQISCKEIKKELEAQLLFFKENKVDVYGVNSEQHIHAFEPVYSIISSFANKNNIKVRNIESIKNYLKPKLHRHAVFIVVFFISQLVYKKRHPHGCCYEIENIVHPGSNYD